MRPRCSVPDNVAVRPATPGPAPAGRTREARARRRSLRSGLRAGALAQHVQPAAGGSRRAGRGLPSDRTRRAQSASTSGQSVRRARCARIDEQLERVAGWPRSAPEMACSTPPRGRRGRTGAGRSRGRTTRRPRAAAAVAGEAWVAHLGAALRAPAASTKALSASGSASASHRARDRARTPRRSHRRQRRGGSASSDVREVESSRTWSQCAVRDARTIADRPSP